MCGVRVVGPGLPVDAKRPETNKHDVPDEGDGRPPDVHDVCYGLDEEQEHGEDGTDDIVLRDAATPTH